MKKYSLLFIILFTPVLIYILMSRGTHGARYLGHSQMQLCPLLADLDSKICDSSQITVLHFGGNLEKQHLLAWVNLYETVYSRLQKTKGLRFITLTTLPQDKAFSRVNDEVKFAMIDSSRASWRFIFATPDNLDSLANRAGIRLDAAKGSDQLLLIDRSGEVRQGLRDMGDEMGDGLRHDATSFNALKKGLLEDIKALFKEYYYAYKQKK